MCWPPERWTPPPERFASKQEIDKRDKEPLKAMPMSREDALLRAGRAVGATYPRPLNTPSEVSNATRETVAILEALGLVKFEEPRVAPPAEVIARSTVTTANRATRQPIGADDAERIILNLEACGFQIVRKDAA